MKTIAKSGFGLMVGLMLMMLSMAALAETFTAKGPTVVNVQKSDKAVTVSWSGPQAFQTVDAYFSAGAQRIPAPGKSVTLAADKSPVGFNFINGGKWMLVVCSAPGVDGTAPGITLEGEAFFDCSYVDPADGQPKGKIGIR